MQCPLVGVFLSRLLADLDRSSINKDLLDEAAALWNTADTGALEKRTLFCCRAVLDRLAAHFAREAAAPIAKLLELKHLPLSSLRDGITALEKLAVSYDIEIAEYKMGVEQRDAMQLVHDDDVRQRRQVVDALRVLHAALEGNACVMGEHFYSFMYRDLQDSEALMDWARALVEMKPHGE